MSYGDIPRRVLTTPGKRDQVIKVPRIRVAAPPTNVAPTLVTIPNLFSPHDLNHRGRPHERSPLRRIFVLSFGVPRPPRPIPCIGCFAVGLLVPTLCLSGSLWIRLAPRPRSGTIGFSRLRPLVPDSFGISLSGRCGGCPNAVPVFARPPPLPGTFAILTGLSIGAQILPPTALALQPGRHELIKRFIGPALRASHPSPTPR